MTDVIGIDPTVDFAFKLVFGSPEHSGVTIHFLNAILGDGPKIARVEFRNPFSGKEFDGDKLSILDILAVDEHGRSLNIEMQTSLAAGLRQRLAYYDACLYVDQMLAGESYQQLRPAIVICVLSVPLFPARTRLHTDFRLRDQTGLVLTDDLQVHTLELTKLAVTRENLAGATAVERWAYFMLEAPKMTVREVRELFPDPEFEEAAGVLEMIKQTESQMHEYRARMKLCLDDAARIDYARAEGAREGREEGREEGERKGRQEGREEGLAEGEQKGERRGELLGRIATIQEVLSICTPTRDELSNFDLAQLAALVERLQDRLRNRGQ